MKGRTLILIFLFLLLALCIPVSADNSSFYFNQSSTSQNDETLSYTVNSGSDVIASIHVNDMDAFQGVRHIILTAPHAYWAGPSSNSEWAAVEYKIGSVVVATGTFGFNKGASNYYVGAFFDEENQIFDQYSGAQGIEIIGSYPAIRWSDAGTVYDTSLGTDIDMGYLALGSGGNAHAICGRTGVSTTQTTISYDFSNKILYDTVDGNFNLWIEKQGQNSKYDISNVHETFFYEASVNTNDQYILNTDIQNSTWTVEAENGYGDVFSKTISFMVASSGTIELNQTNYVDPENIQVEWDILNFNSDNYNYEIQIVTSVSGDPSQDSWAADGNWNTSPFISSASGAAVFDFYSDGYDLPIWVQAELWAQDKSTGTWTKLDNTPAVIYHEAALEAGKVWTDKESYNVTEIVTIYTDTVDGGYLMIDKRNDPLYDSYNIYSGLSHVKFSLQTSHVGTWDVYLYENSVITNSTVFTVLADNDTAYFSWWGDVQKGEAAYYDYVATSSNSVITIYDGIGEKQYSFNATSGYNEGQISTMPGEAGNWTGSLYDGGVYYNSSLEVYASESWIRFVDDGYYLGDTIEIEYFIVEDWCKIRLKDGLCQYGGRSTILTWMPGSFRTGQRDILEFTLSDDNEFGLQVETNLESGYYLPGEWRVEALFETEKGYAFVDDTTYVHGTAKEDGDDPAAVSNEMIGIFFSPHGIFLMFTVIITVMGLAVTKQPAGGAVCAVVGVGFGRFFNVLPTWMLLLTIIALVAFAGVSTAIYIKGK